MGLKVYEASPPEVAELAKKLPLGRLYANGRGFRKQAGIDFPGWDASTSYLIAESRSFARPAAYRAATEKKKRSGPSLHGDQLNDKSAITGEVGRRAGVSSSRDRGLVDPQSFTLAHDPLMTAWPRAAPRETGYGA
jgi:hypothetical protein